MKSIEKLSILLFLIGTILGKSSRPLGGSITHRKLTPRSIKYHKIIPNSKHDRIKKNRNLKIEMAEEHEEEGPFDEEDEEWQSGEADKSIGELEMEVDDAIHENDHLEDEKHEDDGEEEEEEDNNEEEKAEEDSDPNDGNRLEDTIVGVEIHRLQYNIDTFRDLIIDCIDREYAKDMFMDQEIVTLICLGERYEIIERTYHEYLGKIHRIFDKIWRHKVSDFRDTYKDDIILFFNIVKMVTLKDLHLRKTMETAEQNIKYTMDPKVFAGIMEEVAKEIDAYDEIRGNLVDSKNKIQEHLDEREREKKEALDKLKEAEDHMDQEELRYEDAHPDKKEDEEGGRDIDEFDDGYAEDESNLEDEEEESPPPEEKEESEEDLSYDPEDIRGQYDSEDASVGPEGESTPSMDSSQRLQALKNPHEPTPDTDISEEKIDRP